MSAFAELSTDRFTTGLIRVGSALAGAWVVMSFTYPFGWDQGLFAWVGDAIVRGGLPYRDAWDFKGPLLYYVYALAQWLFRRAPLEHSRRRRGLPSSGDCLRLPNDGGAG
jgi:hypothetical protein